MAAKTPPSDRGKTKVFIVDDHPIVRQGIRLLVNQEPGLEVVGEADNVHDALAEIDRLHPDIAVVDLSLKGGSGLDLIKDIQIRHPGLAVLVLSMRDESFYAERVLRAGARGYITKEEGSEKVIEGIREILSGKVYLSGKMASKMLSGMVGATKARELPSVRDLSDRELEVFELVGQGMPTRDIAARLHLSVKTVESHREHIKEKLGLDSASDLLRHAIQWVQNQAGP
jgi:DNA-binding NarL/FixJ family response regulator